MVALRQNTGRVVDTYIYYHANGNPAYRVLRYDPKDFRQQWHDGSRWQWGLGIYKNNPLPFDLPDLLAAKDAGRIIFVVEGERKAHTAAAQLGIVTTCNNGGAGHWGAAQSAYLKGAHVGILPDNDTAGRDHVARTAQALYEAGAASIRVIELPGLTEKGDIADWIDAGGTVDDLKALYKAAPEYTPGALDHWLKTRPKTERPAIVQRSTEQREPTSDDQARGIAYSRAALDRICNDLAGVSDGRFAAMKAAANRLGTMAAHGWLTESECVAALLSACDANGYTDTHGGANVTEKRIRKYFESGLPHKCELPPPLKTQPPNQPNFTGSTVNPDLFKHGLTDIAAAALQLCFSQTVVPMLFIWYAAIAAGIIGKGEGADPVKLADAALHLGYASDPNERRKLLKMLRAGLKEAAKVGLIGRVQKSVTVLQITGEGDQSVTSDPANTAADFWTLKDPATICAAIWESLPARSQERHYPTEDVYKTTRSGDVVKVIAAVLAEPRALWLDPDPDAPCIVADVIALGTPERDPKAEKRAAQVLNSDALCFAKLGTDLTVTPLPCGWQFASVREYTAGRWRGLIDVQPDLQRPKWWWARWLGVAESTLAASRKLAGLEAVQHIDPVPVCSAAEARRAAADRKAFPQVITITNRDGEARRTPFDGKADHVIDAAVKRGDTVAVVLQAASTQRVVAAEQPKVKPRKPRESRPAERVEPVVLAATPKPAIVVDIPPPRPDAPTGRHTGPGHDPEWVRGQLILRMKRIGFVESGWDILNQYGEFVSRLPFGSLSNAQVIELARGRNLIASDVPPISVEAACRLHAPMCLAERAARLAGQPDGAGRATYLATLTEAERDAVLRFDRGEEW